MKMGKINACSSDDPHIQEAARYAVSLYKCGGKSITTLNLVSVEKAAVEDFEGGVGTIYYLLLKANFVRGDQPTVYTDAVLVYEGRHMDSVGLDEVFEGGYGFEADSEEEDSEEEEVWEEEEDLEFKLHPNRERAANFALKCHNDKMHTQLKLVNALPSLCVSKGIYTIDHFKLLAKDQEGRLTLFYTSVTTALWDESWKSMESAGLIYLCEAHAKPPHINPDWIPLHLLLKVREKWTNQHHIFYLPMLDNDLSISQLPQLSALLLGGKERREVLTPFLSEKNGVVSLLMFKNKLSISQLPQPAPVLGEKATREVLIPFLAENNGNVVNEGTLCLLAEKLVLLIECVGGSDYAHVLLPALESLCTIEQPIVRNKAVESLCQIGEQMKENDLLTFFVPFVQKLADGESVAGRFSSCGLFHIAYCSAPENLKIELFKSYRRLCKDASLLVRISAALNFGKFATTVKSPPHPKADTLSLYEDLALDDEKSVRVFAAKLCTTVVNLLVQKNFLLEILSAIQKLSRNDFWRVRETVAKRFGDLCQAVSPFGENNWSGLVSAYGHLLQDKSEEVCMAAAKQLGEVCRILNTQSTFDDVLPRMKKLSFDPSVRVRSALASGIMALASVLEKDLTNKHLIPTIKHLLQDETAEVRLKIISNIDNLTKVIGVDLLSGSLLDVSKKKDVGGHWVFMPTIIKSIPLLAKWLGAGHYQMLRSLCDEALKDKFRITRKAAKYALEKLGELDLSGNATILQDSQSRKHCPEERFRESKKQRSGVSGNGM